jgi:hypothetical protein
MTGMKTVSKGYEIFAWPLNMKMTDLVIILDKYINIDKLIATVTVDFKMSDA